MAKVNYKIEGNLLPIEIQTSKGVFQILAKTVVVPDGDRCVVYDCYCVSLNTLKPNATDIEYYIGKIKKIADLFEQDNAPQEILKKMVQDHINQHGRIIDNDLMMIVSALRRSLEAFVVECDRQKLILSALDIVLNNYADKTFITVYNQTPYGTQPHLVLMNKFINKRP